MAIFQEQEINDLTLKVTPVATDEIEIQETGGGVSRKTTIGSIPKGTAAQITNTPAGNIASTDVQAAINELDSEKKAVTTVEAVATGGTGQTTAQAAIDALSNVAAATDEHVLTKDTSTGNAIFKVSTGADTSLSNLTVTGNNKIASAWVSLNGVGVIAINDSYNVSSITDVAVGQYQVNFATAMANANYSIATSNNASGSGGIPYNGATLPTTTDVKLVTTNASSFVDSTWVSAIIFGGL